MEFLIEPHELQSLAQKDELLVLDARRPADYAKGHIPGAVNFSTYDDFALDTRPEGLAAFARNLAARYAGVLSGKDPSLLSTTLRSRGTGTFYQVRVGAETRAAADALCANIRRAGGACMVLRNRPG